MWNIGTRNNINLGKFLLYKYFVTPKKIVKHLKSKMTVNNESEPHSVVMLVFSKKNLSKNKWTVHETHD